MNMIVQSGPAQDRTCAMSGPLSRSMASLATLDKAWVTVPPDAQADPRPASSSSGARGAGAAIWLTTRAAPGRRWPGSSRTRP